MDEILVKIEALKKMGDYHFTVGKSCLPYSSSEVVVLVGRRFSVKNSHIVTVLGFKKFSENLVFVIRKNDETWVNFFKLNKRGQIFLNDLEQGDYRLSFIKISKEISFCEN